MSDSRLRVLTLVDRLSPTGGGERLAMQIATAIVEHGRVTRGYLGIGTQPIQLEGSLSEAAGQDRGLLVVHVAEGSPAASAGFLQGDILIKLRAESSANSVG